MMGRILFDGKRENKLACDHHECSLCRDEIFHVLCCAPYCRLAVAEKNQPYIVPMHFDSKFEDGKLWFWLYSLPCGEKMHCIEANNKIALEFELCCDDWMDTVIVKGTVIRIIEANCACGCGENPVAIEILARSVSGRRFKSHCNCEGWHVSWNQVNHRQHNPLHCQRSTGSLKWKLPAVMNRN